MEAASFHALPRIVSRFRGLYPEVQLELVEMITMELNEALLRGRLDAALLRPIKIEEPLQYRIILKEPYVIALSGDHSLAEKASLSLAEIIDEGLVIAPGRKAHHVRSVFRPLFERLQREPYIVQEINQLHGIIGLVGGGVGYTLVPSSAASLQIAGVTYKPIADPDAPLAELAVAWMPSRATPLLENLLQVTREVRRDMTKPSGT
ncbi:LysR family substrate-binding domain-containing protein [Pararhizobium mangrovi]|uniref:LysR family substrate-binding domain-containing protein n=1 Tax=Pararhizobium mangrovi TaxID=2590452 RepID=UPI001F2F048C|nr:LysR family substrate-binding domain-containing protein [Pararhizobium mangrovi]